MSDETEPVEDGDSAADVGHDPTAPRTTAPMSEYGSREVGYGLAFLVVGVVLAFGLPLLATTL